MEDRVEHAENGNGLHVEKPVIVHIRPDIGAAAHLPEREQRDTAPSLPPLPWQAALLSIITFAAGLAAVAVYAPSLQRDGLVGLVLLTALAAISHRMSILVYSESKVSVSFICVFAIGVLYGPAGVAIAAPLAVIVLHVPNHIFSYRFLFNLGSAILTNVLAAVVLWSIFDAEDIGVSPEVVAASLLAATASYVVNSFLVTIVASIATGQSPRAIWEEKFQWLFPHYAVFGLLGLALGLSYQALGTTGIIAFMAPPFMMRLAMKQYVDKTARHVATLKHKNEQLERANRDILAMSSRLKETYDATLEALASALDARDRETAGHSSRVTVYTMDMARKMGIREGTEEWLDIERASLLHDVGKIGVSDAILNKAGPLTAEEWEEMRRHPVIGYTMLKDVRFLSSAAEIVYSHHERYDGKGYPTGLEGEAIPLGARIFAIADAFDAMTSDRPYRRALNWEKACDEILANAGAQFDPKVIDAFLECLSEWTAGLKSSAAA